MPDTTAVSLLPTILVAGSAAVASASGLLAYSVFSPRCQFWAPVVRSLPQAEAVALTFDDGPHPHATPRILDLLAAHHVKATFFIIGRHATSHPDLIRRIAAEGHVLGNHSYDHHHFGINKGRAYWFEQVRATQAAVADITGQPPVLFRPPMGFKHWHVAAAVQEARLPIIGWSVRGYDTRPVTPSALAKRVLRRMTGHDIVLLHDGIDPERARKDPNASQQATVDALPTILEGIHQKKLRPVTVVESLLAGAADRERAASRLRGQVSS